MYNQTFNCKHATRRISECRERNVYKHKTTLYTLLQKTSSKKLRVNRSSVRQWHCCKLHVTRTISHDVKNREIYQDFCVNNKWNSLHVRDVSKPVIDFLKTLYNMHNVKMKISKRYCQFTSHRFSTIMKQQIASRNEIPQMLLNFSNQKWKFIFC